MAATGVVRENIKEEGTLDYVNNKDDLCLFTSFFFFDEHAYSVLLPTLCISVLKTV